MQKVLSKFLSAFTVFSMLVVPLTPLNVIAHHDPFGGVPQSSVLICHQTGNGGYVTNSPSVSSTGELQGGHSGHSGDIIPPFHYSDGTNVVASAGKNWNAVNEDKWASGNCTGDGILAATLTLLKTVVNNNNGTAVDSNFTLSASGPTPTSGVEGSVAVTNKVVTPGAYTLSESGGPAGYTASLYSCVKNGGAPVVSNSVTLVNNDIVVCTITNDDNVPEPIDVCLNLEGTQTVVPQGYESLSEGQCTLIPVDVCTNIEGNQSTLPEGYEFASAGICVPIPVDVCENLEGMQTEVPGGYESLSEGQCTLIPVDVCPNIEGTQTEVPEGMQINEGGQCVAIPVDVCPNLEGTQTEVPEGYHMEEGSCVLDTPPDMCPNIEGTQETVPEGMQVNEEGQCVNIPVDVCLNLEGTQTEVPEGYESLSEGQCTLIPVDVCPNIEGTQTEVPEGYHMEEGSCVEDVPEPELCTDESANNVGRELPCTYDEVTECSDEVNNNDNDELADANDPDCHTDGDADNEESYDPSDDNEDEEDNGGGGSSSSGSRPDRPQGEVLGAATEICNWNTQYLRRGWNKNVSNDVQTMQNFLNLEMTSGLAVDSVFGPLTEAAVKAFQAKHKADILTPWGINNPTGIWYLSTTTKAKEIMCGEKTALPPLVNWSQNPAVR